MDENKKNGISTGIKALTYEEISEKFAGHNLLCANIVPEAKNPECLIGLKGADDPEQIYKVAILAENKIDKTFKIYFPSNLSLSRENCETIAADSGRFVDLSLASDAVRQPPNSPTTITYKNENYRPSARCSTPVESNTGVTGRKESWEFEEEMKAALRTTIENKPPPQPRPRVRFSEETSVMDNPNRPNPIEYNSNMTEDDAVARAIALSLAESGGAVALASGVEPGPYGALTATAPSAPPPAPPLPTARDLTELEFDLVIEEIAEYIISKAPDAVTMNEEKASEVVPDYLTGDTFKPEAIGNIDLYDGLPETQDEWFARLKRTKVVSESDHLRADIVIE